MVSRLEFVVETPWPLLTCKETHLQTALLQRMIRNLCVVVYDSVLDPVPDPCSQAVHP